MNETSPLYAKLLGETARIDWKELEPFFARGALLWVAEGEDLVALAEAVAGDDRAGVAVAMERGALQRLEVERAQDLLARDPQLWAVVVAPWVLVQERSQVQPATTQR